MEHYGSPALAGAPAEFIGILGLISPLFIIFLLCSLRRGGEAEGPTLWREVTKNSRQQSSDVNFPDRAVEADESGFTGKQENHIVFVSFRTFYRHIRENGVKIEMRPHQK